MNLTMGPSLKNKKRFSKKLFISALDVSSELQAKYNYLQGIEEITLDDSLFLE